jgi:hypothetical protein
MLLDKQFEHAGRRKPGRQRGGLLSAEYVVHGPDQQVALPAVRP